MRTLLASRLPGWGRRRVRLRRCLNPGLAFSQLAAIAFDGLINFPAIIDYAYIFGVLAACLFVVFRCKNSVKLLEEFSPSRGRLIATVLMFCVSLLCMTRESIFIYFNF